jgi:putative nucleotidyltransferase with HDIG domain
MQQPRRPREGAKPTTPPARATEGRALGDPDRMAAEIERHLRARIAGGSIPLPSMPRAVVQCLQLLQSPDVALENIARVLETDPPLAARVLSVANSPRFASLQRAANLRQAVTRLGLREMKVVVTEAAVRSVFSSGDARIADACQGIWTHSRAVALIARELAIWVAAGNPEDAYLAGLLHDVGKPIVAGFLLDVERATVGSQISAWMKAQDWIGLVQRIHRPVGLSFGARWQMPAAVQQAIEGSAEYQPDADRAMGNCVRLANEWAKRLGIYVGEPDYQEVDSLISEGISRLGLEPAQVDELGAGLDELLGEQ